MKSNIALFGRSGSGKTTIARHLEQHHHYFLASSGALCRNISQLLFRSQSKTILDRLTDAVKAIDEEAWLNAALRDVPDHRPIVFDSMRFDVDYRALRSKGFLLWRIEAPLAVCVERLGERGQEFNLGVDDTHPAESQLETFQYDYCIKNSEVTLEGLYELVQKGLGV